MPPKRKRVRCIESDDEDSQAVLLDAIKDSLNPKIENVADEIKYEIHLSRDETQYVHKKHHDQARMLAILNQKLEAEQKKNSDQDMVIRNLNEDIKTLQDNALGDCAGMFDQVNARLRTVIDEQREIKKNMKSMKEDIKTIKSLLETLIKHE